MTNRHVPIITGVVGLGIGAGLVFGLGSWWAWLLGVPIAIFGWMSLNMGLSATDDEVAAMTSMEPMSAELKSRVQDRIAGDLPPTPVSIPAAVVSPGHKAPAGSPNLVKAPYQKLVMEIVDGAMAVDIFSGEAFSGNSINRLEATMATLWMITRSLFGLKDDRSFDMAAKLAVHSVLEILSNEYSEQEFTRMVMPTYKRRMDQYNEMFSIGPSEAAQAPLMRVCKKIVENVCGEEEAHISQIMTVALVGWETISMLSKEILTLDNIGRVGWDSSGSI